jgi:hypothetical protein
VVGEDELPEVFSGNFGETEWSPVSLLASVCVRVSNVMPAESGAPEEAGPEVDSSLDSGDAASVEYPASFTKETFGVVKPASS